MPLAELEFRLTHPSAFRIVNLRSDHEIVDSRIEAATSGGATCHRPAAAWGRRRRNADCFQEGNIGAAWFQVYLPIGDRALQARPGDACRRANFKVIGQRQRPCHRPGPPPSLATLPEVLGRDGDEDVLEIPG